MNGRKRAQTAVASLQFLTDKAVGNVGKTGATVAFQGSAEHTHLAKGHAPLVEENAFLTCLLDLGDDGFVNPLANHVANHDFFLGQQAFDVVKVKTLKRLHVIPRYKGHAGASSTCPLG